MPQQTTYDAVIVGSGPNGLAAAITIARQAAPYSCLRPKRPIGGGARSQALTLARLRPRRLLSHPPTQRYVLILPLSAARPVWPAVDLSAGRLRPPPG